MIPQEWLDDFDLEWISESGEVVRIPGARTLRMTAWEWKRLIEDGVPPVVGNVAPGAA